MFWTLPRSWKQMGKLFPGLPARQGKGRLFATNLDLFCVVFLCAL